MKPLLYAKKLFYIRTQLLQAMKDVYIYNLSKLTVYVVRFYILQNHLKHNFIAMHKEFNSDYIMSFLVQKYFNISPKC